MLRNSSSGNQEIILDIDKDIAMGFSIVDLLIADELNEI